jgi:hypothetical protein
VPKPVRRLRQPARTHPSQPFLHQRREPLDRVVPHGRHSFVMVDQRVTVMRYTSDAPRISEPLPSPALLL